MTTKETFLSENRNEIIEIAQEQMRENGFEYVTLKEVLTMYKDTFDMTMTISEEMEYVIDRLKSENNKRALAYQDNIDAFRAEARGSKWVK
jgi:acyl-[acyl carrier protein]--UDP-N-acetylglucosamine O-acyltransferase